MNYLPASVVRLLHEEQLAALERRTEGARPGRGSERRATHRAVRRARQRDRRVQEIGRPS